MKRRVLVVLAIWVFAEVIAVAQRGPGTPQGAIEAAQPMARNADPAFEVATIKPTDPNDQGQGFHLRGHRIAIENMPAINMIIYAYSVHQSQVINAPKWFDDARWDVDGVPDQPGVPNDRQYQRMVQKLLADRFKLQFHHEKRVLPVYMLTVAKGGPRLESASDPNAPLDQTGHVDNGQHHMKFTSNSMQDFTEGLQFIVGKPVLNQTGLGGHYDFLLRWSDDMHNTDPNASPGFYTAIEEQLGLKLDAVKAPIDVLVIDHVEQPSAN